ncbi:hypothetical protein LTS18_010278, partial [Coniosporium uncinatum]
MQPPSPRTEHRSDYGGWRRPRTPERPNRTSEATSHPRAGQPSGGQGSPEYARAQPHMFHNANPFSASSPQSQREVDATRQPGNVIPQRPNSQPIGSVAPGDGPNQRYDPVGYRRPMFGYSAAEQRKEMEERERRERAMHEHRPPVGHADRERAATAQPLSHSAFSPPSEQRPVPRQHGQPGPAGPPGVYGPYGREPSKEMLREGHYPQRPDFLGMFRTGRDQPPESRPLEQNSKAATESPFQRP